MVPESPPSVPTQKLYRDHVTAHKLALMVLIKEFCAVKNKCRNAKPFQVSEENIWVHTNQQNREFAITMLKLIQNPDMDLKRLNNIVHAILHPNTYQLFLDRLQELRKNGVAGSMDYVQTLEPLLVDPSPAVPVIQKSSVLGLFIRRMLLAFDKLSFSHVTKLCYKFYVYYDAAFGCIDDCGEISFNDSHGEGSLEDSDYEEFHVLASQKQAEFFIAQQAALLQINEREALSPQELQQKIRELLKGNPELSEAHYLSFLNTLRVKEYCGAVENLYHHFDRNTAIPQDGKTAPVSEDTTRSFRYAALNLAILHARFGHRNEALAALKEAIMVAQEVNDNVCLQHALAWLYRLSPDNVETLIERSVSKSAELNLWYLSSLGVQASTQIKCNTSASPSSVFDLVMKSDILNCQHSMTEVMGPAYAQRAALWTHYGNSCMSNLVSELLLYLNTSDPVRGGVYHIGEGTCLALRNLAMSFALEGNYNYATIVLNHAKELFPVHSEYSHIWKLCDLTIKFEKALYCSSWLEAERILGGISIINVQEADYRKVQLLSNQGNLTNAYEMVTKLIAECESKQLSPHYHVRVLLLKATLLCQTVNYNMAIPPLMTCMELCKTHHLIYLEALSVLYVACVQLMLQLPNQALQLLDSVFVTFLAHGSCYDKGCCYLLYAKCTAAAAQLQEKTDVKKEALLSATGLSETAIEYFLKVKAIHRAKYALCWQAHLYNKLGNTDKRNSSAHRFRTLDEQFRCTNWSGVLIP